jgi:hypothetical protein
LLFAPLFAPLSAPPLFDYSLVIPVESSSFIPFDPSVNDMVKTEFKSSKRNDEPTLLQALLKRIVDNDETAFNIASLHASSPL